MQTQWIVMAMAHATMPLKCYTLSPKNANQISWPNHVAAYKIMNKFEYNFNYILLVHTYIAIW